MPGQTAPPARRKRLSKNKKKTWRTLSREVDELLPQQTKMEVAKRRSGGFFIDVGDSSAQQAARTSKKSPLDGLRCFSGLQAEDSSTQRQTKRQATFNERQLKRRTKRALRREDSLEEKPATAGGDEGGDGGGYDMWEADSRLKAFNLPDDRLQMGDLLTYQLRYTRRQPVKRRVTTPQAALPACLVPASGASFNPSLESHQRQLASVQAEEAGRQRQEEKLHNQLERHFPDKSVDLQAQELEEMSAGIFVDDQDDEEEEEEEKKEEDEEEEAKETSEGEKEQQAGEERKEARQSAKEAKEAKRQRAAAAERKRARRVAHELGQLPAVARRVEASLSDRRSREAARLAKRLAKAAGTKRLGRRKFKEVEEEFKMPSELTPTLRQLRPEGDLFVDAVKSLQRRNVLEPTERAKWRPRYKPKRVGKRNRQPDRMPDRRPDRLSDGLTDSK